jgi:hypothetical protein
VRVLVFSMQHSPQLIDVALEVIQGGHVTFVHAQMLPEIIMTAKILITPWERTLVRCDVK